MLSRRKESEPTAPVRGELTSHDLVVGIGAAAGTAGALLLITANAFAGFIVLTSVVAIVALIALFSEVFDSGARPH